MATAPALPRARPLSRQRRRGLAKLAKGARADALAILRQRADEALAELRAAGKATRAAAPG